MRFLFAVAVVILGWGVSAVPLPRQQANPIVGEWSIQWGECEQTTWFAADGSCDSCRFGPGVWSVTEDGDDVTIWFSERNDESHYAAAFDRRTGIGAGYTVDGERGRWSCNVQMKRVGEAQRKPKEGGK